ncbi:hypothetical protein QCA50_008065 [Cerrena zonata]|uniref:Lectin n=1 Tax=Cerrena zonata TaxID=2478898 RepID=A0AAW0GEX2_9APHY
MKYLFPWFTSFWCIHQPKSITPSIEHKESIDIDEEVMVSQSNSVTDASNASSDTIEADSNPSPIPQHKSQSPEQPYPYRMRFEVSTFAQETYRIDDKGLRDSSIDEWQELPNGSVQLCMDHSGTSGSLIFQGSSSGERFSVAAGIHNYNPWCDILTDLPPEAYADAITVSYYGPRSGRLWDNFKEYSIQSSKGTQLSIVISMAWDGTFVAKVTIASDSSSSAPPSEPAPPYSSQ